MGQTPSTNGSDQPSLKPRGPGEMTVHTKNGNLFANIPQPTLDKELVQCLPDNPELFAITVSNVFSPEECDELIRISEETGYEPALLNVGGGEQVLATDIRNNDRTVIDSLDFARLVFDRIKEYLPARIAEGHYGRHGAFDLAGVNERFRFLRYGVGMEFKPHYDGTFVRHHDPTAENYREQSFFTLQIYLNDVEKGGETSFFVPPLESQDGIGVNPRKGMIILFQHNIYHSGSPVLAGQKYCIRSDIMYKPLD